MIVPHHTLLTLTDHQRSWRPPHPEARAVSALASGSQRPSAVQSDDWRDRSAWHPRGPPVGSRADGVGHLSCVSIISAVAGCASPGPSMCYVYGQRSRGLPRSRNFFRPFPKIPAGARDSAAPPCARSQPRGHISDRVGLVRRVRSLAPDGSRGSADARRGRLDFASCRARQYRAASARGSVGAHRLTGLVEDFTDLRLKLNTSARCVENRTRPRPTRGRRRRWRVVEGAELFRITCVRFFRGSCRWRCTMRSCRRVLGAHGSRRWI